MHIAKSLLWFSVIDALCVLIASASGILFAGVYARETTSMAIQGMSQDIVNLLAVVALLIATYFLSQGSLKAYLVWSGVLLYLLYAYVIYAFDVHQNRLFLLYVAILGLTFYALAGSVVRLQADRIRAAFAAATPVRWVSGFLMVLGILFYLLWLRDEIPALLTGQIPSGITDINVPTNPVHVLDLAFYLPAMLMTAVLLWRRNVWGYLLAGPLLVFSTLTATAILVIMLISGSRGMSTSVGIAAIFALIILVSLCLSARYIGAVKDHPKSAVTVSGKPLVEVAPLS